MGCSTHVDWKQTSITAKDVVIINKEKVLKTCKEQCLSYLLHSKRQM